MVQHVQDKGIYLGSLYSFTPVAMQLSSMRGGLIWIDGETGCTVVLRRYE
jgi:hypothetical protein